MTAAIIIMILSLGIILTFVILSDDEFKNKDDYDNDEDNESQEKENNELPVKDIIKQNNTFLKDEFKDKLTEFKLSPKIYLILVISLTTLSIIIGLCLNFPLIKIILFINILLIPLDIMRIRDTMYSGCSYSIAIIVLIFINIIIFSVVIIGISHNSEDQKIIIGSICFVIFYKTLAFGESLEGQTKSFVQPKTKLQIYKQPNQNTYKKTDSDLSKTNNSTAGNIKVFKLIVKGILGAIIVTYVARFIIVLLPIVLSFAIIILPLYWIYKTLFKDND